METTTLKKTDDFTILKLLENNSCVFLFNPKSSKNDDDNLILDISDYIAEQPSESLKKLAYTADLENEWFKLKKFNRCIATYFWTLYFEVEDYPFEDNLKDKFALELCEFIALRYLCLWRMIKAEFSSLKDQLSDCPKTEKELFYKIIEEVLNQHFEALIENDHVEYVPSQLKEGLQELMKPPKYIDWKKVKKLAPIHCRNTSGFNRIADVLQIIAKQASKKNKHKLRYLCDSFNSATRRINEILSDAITARNNQGKRIPTSIWRNGILEYKSWGRNWRVQHD